MAVILCAVQRRLISSGCESHPATVAPAGSNRSSSGGNEAAEAFGVEGHFGDSASMQAVTWVNAEQASKRPDAEADPSRYRGRPPPQELKSEHTLRFRRGSGDGMHVLGDLAQHGNPRSVEGRDFQPDAREGQAGLGGVADRPVVPLTPGNAGRGKGPWFKANVRKE